MPPSVKTIAAVMRALGQRKSRRKSAASRANLEKARALRWAKKSS